MKKKRTAPWEKIFLGVGIIFLVIATACYLLLNQIIMGIVVALIGGMFINFSMGTTQNRTIWQKLRWPAMIVIVLIWTGVASFGRHTYTGEITKITRVEERHNGYHYEVTLQNGKTAYQLIDSVNVLIGKSQYVHLHVSDRRVKVTTAGLLPNNFLIKQNILSVK